MPSLDGLSMLIFGEPKIGKSSFCSGLDDVMFGDVEGGLKFLKTPRKRIPSWREFLKLVDKVVSREKLSCDAGYRKNFVPKHFVLDTVDVLYMLCMEYCCKKFGFDHPGDAEYGKGWNIVGQEFARPLAKINSTLSMVLISHAKAVEQRGRGSTKTSRIVPTMPGSARKVVMPMVDVIAYTGFEAGPEGAGKERVIIFQPSEELECGDRSGCLPPMMPLDPRQLDKYPLVPRDTPWLEEKPPKSALKLKKRRIK